MNNPITYRTIGPAAHVVIDDGKRNVMSPTMLWALHDALDRAGRDASAVLLTGRPGVFSAGFDLRVFARGKPEEVHEMMKLGSELALRIFEYPIPIVTACTGHAFPMGPSLCSRPTFVSGQRGYSRSE